MKFHAIAKESELTDFFCRNTPHRCFLIRGWIWSFTAKIGKIISTKNISIIFQTLLCFQPILISNNQRFQYKVSKMLYFVVFGEICGMMLVGLSQIIIYFEHQTNINISLEIWDNTKIKCIKIN